MAIVSASIFVVAITFAAQDEYTLKSPSGISFSEFSEAPGAMIALYLNVFVGVVQAFRRIPLLQAMAPQQTESQFVIAQLVVLALFILLTISAARRCQSDQRAHA